LLAKLSASSWELAESIVTNSNFTERHTAGIWRGVLALVVGVLTWWSGSVMAEPLECVPGTGFWEFSAEGNASLKAALCARPGSSCPELTRFEFTAAGTEVFVALTPESYSTCESQWVGRVGKFALLHDGVRLLAVDAESLRVTAVFPYTCPTLVSEHGDRVLLMEPAQTTLLRATGDKLEVVSRIALPNPLEAIWQDHRLVVVANSKVTFWPMSEDGAIGAPASFGGDSPFVAGAYVVDDDAVLSTFEDGDRRRILWQPFDGSAPRRVTLAAEELVLGVASSMHIGAVLTTDGQVARVIAKADDGLRDRVVLNNWGLTEADRVGADGKPKSVFYGNDRWLFVDGGEARGNRAVPISTDEAQWRTRRAIEYDFRGNIVFASHDSVFITHPDGKYAFSIWTTQGGRRRRISSSKLAEYVGGIASIEQLSRRKFLLVGEDRRLAVFDLKSGSLRSLGPATDGSEHFSPPTRFGDDQLLYVEDGGPGTPVKSWRFVNKSSGEERRFVPAGEVKDALGMRERWFGYCVPGQPCQSSLPMVDRVDGDDHLFEGLSTVQHRRPLALAWWVSALSLLLLVAVTVWRMDVGRSASPTLKPQGRGPEVTGRIVMNIYALFDNKGRRVPGPADRTEFIHKSIFTRFPFRFGVVFMASALPALWTTYRYLLAEPTQVWLPILLGIALPLGTLLWVLSSWMVWNRRHLFRFGQAVEGQWTERGRIRTATYQTPDGKTFALQGASSTSAIPIVLFDPRRPQFATHFTAVTDLGVQPAKEPTETKGSGNGYFALPLLIILALVLPLIPLGFSAYDGAFGEALPEHELRTLTAKAADGNMLGLCLEVCADFGDRQEDCELQCHRRQLRIALESGGVLLDGDPERIAGDLLLAQSEEFQGLLSDTFTQTGTCSSLAASLTAKAPWTVKKHRAFKKFYGSAEALERDAALRESQEILEQLDAELFQPLCSATSPCLQSAECVVPFECTGSTQSLQRSLCALWPALRPIASASAGTRGGSP